MTSDRLRALTDGVIAVIITIMVLDLRPPHGATPHDLLADAPTFLAYVLSFLYVAIYWNNHHHFLALAPTVDGLVLWANFALLFALSLIPFGTAWMGDEALRPWPTALYGAILLASALAWLLLQAAIIRLQGPHSPLRAAIGRDRKGKLSPLLYLAGIALSVPAPPLAALLYLAVALLWIVPDLRIHRALAARPPEP